MVLVVVLVALLSGPASADLRSAPTWYDQNAVGSAPDWHYRVPVNVPAGATVNSTIKVDVDFNALLAAMGVSGTFDVNSPRILRPGGSLAVRQEFTDTIFNGVTDASGNGRGEIRFILEDAGASVYHLYFDITQNGAKAANPQTPINGNFERGATGTTQPAGWNAPTGNTSLDAQVRPSETPSVTTNGTNAYPSPKTTDGSPRTGAFSYMIGSRSQNETGDFSRTITKTFVVPATNPGNFTARWRVEGWDSTGYDTLTIRLNAGGTTINVVGPAYGNYTTAPHSPNLSNATNAPQNAVQPGYRAYNYFDMTSTGAHTQGMSVAAQAEPWWTRTVSLASLAGQTVTLTIQSTHINQFRSWFHIDDLEWSVVDATLGTPQGFGVVFLTPTTATAVAGTIAITARVDANPTASSSPVTVDLVNPGGTATRTVPLFNDGTHGDVTAGDAIWTNDGSVAADRMTLTSGSLNGSWRLRVFARDASTSTTGARNGVIRGPGTGAAPETEANYWNIDEFLLGGGAISVTKTSSIVSDPFNGTTNPKRIPGSTVRWCVVVTNIGASAATAIVLADTINVPEVYVAGSIRSGTTCINATTVEDDNNSGADESDPVGANFTGSTVNGTTATLAASASIALTYNITVQ
ncbi:MAG: hypothetical protein ACKVRO_00100 [Micropepsaceae bacterium]